MSKEISRLDILFKDPNATYKAGDVLAGNVYLELNSEFKLKGVKIHFHGISRVAWDEKRAYTKGSASKLSHKNMDVYLDETVMIMRKNGSLPPGRHDWPFTLRLPVYLPATFEGQWGRVQYWAKVVIDRPWKGDVDLTKNFLVQGALDLNAEPDSRKPIEGCGEIMVGTLCCKSGPISGHIALEKRGYICGHNIPFSATVQNTSSKKINVRVVLFQVVTFRADKEVRKITSLMKGLTKGEMGPNEDLHWEDEIKNVPTMPPTKLGGGCKNIEVKYVLKLIAVPSGPGTDLEIPVEVVIGTVPLRNIEQGSPTMTVKAAARTMDTAMTLQVITQDGKLTPSPMMKRASLKYGLQG